LYLVSVEGVAMSPGSGGNIALPNMPGMPNLAPLFGMAPGQKKPQQKSPVASYLGSDASPNKAQVGQKTLLGS
jgi:hypothetical protein